MSATRPEPPFSKIDQTSPRGSLTLILGCMFSGKTTELLRILGQRPADEVLAFKPRLDTRFGREVIGSHARGSFPAVAIGKSDELLAALCRERPATEVSSGQCPRLVAVDEAHFFNPDIVEAFRNIRDKGMDLIVTALDRDSWGRPFPAVERMRAMARSVREKTTFCARCGAIADHTQRLTPIVDRTMVGGSESYEPRCADCWHAPPETAP